MKIFILLCVALAANGSLIDPVHTDGDEKIDPAIIDVIRNLVQRGRDVVNAAVANAIEGSRDSFSEGWPEIGIAPLDPLYIGDSNFQFSVHSSNFDISVNETFLRGLQKFKIEKVDVRLLQLSSTIVLSFDELQLDGYHSSRGTLQTGIFPNNFNGEGPYTINLYNVEFRAFIDFNIVNGYLNLKTLNVEYSVQSSRANLTGFGTFTGVAVNSILQTAIPGIIADSQESVNVYLESNVVPAVNTLLSQFKLSELLINFAREAIREAIRGLVCNEM